MKKIILRLSIAFIFNLAGLLHDYWYFIIPINIIGYILLMWLSESKIFQS
jgi:hypothetical protein